MNDWIDSLVRHGFKKIYWLNGHGGNIATIQAAIAESYAAWSMDGDACPYRLKSENWFTLPGVMDVCRSIFPVGEGSHATASEVSVTYYAYPEHQKSVEMSPKIAPEGRFADAADYRAAFPDGRIGSDPSQASPERGERIVAAAKSALIKDVQSFFES